MVAGSSVPDDHERGGPERQPNPLFPSRCHLECGRNEARRVLPRGLRVEDEHVGLRVDARTVLVQRLANPGRQPVPGIYPEVLAAATAAAADVAAAKPVGYDPEPREVQDHVDHVQVGPLIGGARGEKGAEQNPPPVQGTSEVVVRERGVSRRAPPGE
jgi:hypothetical protein